MAHPRPNTVRRLARTNTVRRLARPAPLAITRLWWGAYRLVWDGAPLLWSVTLNVVRRITGYLHWGTDPLTWGTDPLTWGDPSEGD